jgi:predicted phosphodiesterase
MENKQYQELKELVLEKARQYKKEKGYISWARIEQILDEVYPDHELTKDAIRAIYRRNDDDPYKETKNKYAEKSRQRKSGRDTLKKILLVKLQRKSTVSYLLDVLPVDRETIYAEITRLELDGHEIDKWTENGTQFLQLKRRRHNDSRQVNIQVNEQNSVLVISDTHIGHEKSETEFLQKVIKYAYEQGVRTVLHVGDWVEGNYQSIRPTSIKELVAVGFDDQIELADKVLPKLDGLTYYGISGNHDFTHTRNTFADPVKTLAKIRQDIVYLGHNFGKVTIGKTDIALVHPTDGIGQSYGLKLHKYFERAGVDKQARIVLMGHYHKHTHLHYRGQDGFIVPAMVSQSKFMKDNDLANVVGAFILHLKTNKKGELVTLTPEYIWYE